MTTTGIANDCRIEGISKAHTHTIHTYTKRELELKRGVDGEMIRTG